MLYMSRFLIFYFQCPIIISNACDILLFEFKLLSLVIKTWGIYFKQINLSSTVLIISVFTIK